MCNYCMGTGIKIAEGTKCFCVKAGKRGFFPGMKPVNKRKKANDMLPQAHKHDFKFLHTNMVHDWFMCDCGETKKVALSN